jgi:hypothetical protein
MTEAEWITTKMPLDMLRAGLPVWDERKAFLASYHCLRHAWNRLTDIQRHYVESVTRFVEGEGIAENRDQAFGEVQREFQRTPFDWRTYYTSQAVRCFSHRIGQGSLIEVFRNLAEAPLEKEWQCALIREIFGNPFRPVRADPTWRTSDVLLLARGIYNESAFDRLPILADALQDAGCDNDAVLNHCREPGEHVRGCWVIDLILRK